MKPYLEIRHVFKRDPALSLLWGMVNASIDNSILEKMTRLQMIKIFNFLRQSSNTRGNLWMVRRSMSGIR